MTTEYQTRAVLAAAYPKHKMRDMKPGEALTHIVRVVDGDDAEVLCGRVDPENLADELATDKTAAPSCPRCLGRYESKVRNSGNSSV